VRAPRENVIKLIEYVKNALGFGFLCTITGLDAGDGIELIYHLANDEGIILNVKTNAPKTEPVFETVTGIYNGAMLYELEIHNLLGAVIRGIPDDIPYPLPDGWPSGDYPLRKDWKQPCPGPKGEN
jgi:NADH:ubiquinone oxidoreductase subunit C